MTSERAAGPPDRGEAGTDEAASGDAAAGDGAATDEAAGDGTVEVLGTELVLEGEFVSFPWRAGMARAPGAFVAVFVLTAAVAAVGGFGAGSLQRRFSLLGIAVFNAHNVPATVGVVPGVLAPVAEPISGIAGVWPLVRGLFTAGVGHGAPIDHVGAILGGETDSIGHLSLIERQGETGVSAVVYILPPVALVGAGYEFARSVWTETTSETLADVARFGLAVGAGYVVVMLVGSVLFTARLTGAVTVLPDRYLLLVYAFAYPTIFSTLGAALLYRNYTDEWPRLVD